MKFSIFFSTQYDLLKEKNSPLRRAIFQIFGYKTQNKEETAQNEKNTFLKLVLFPIKK
jgi:hypothetical protein